MYILCTTFYMIDIGFSCNAYRTCFNKIKVSKWKSRLKLFKALYLKEYLYVIKAEICWWQKYLNYTYTYMIIKYVIQNLSCGLIYIAIKKAKKIL